MDRISWTQQALSDLKAVHDFIARDAASYAELLAESLLETVEQLAGKPSLGAPVPETDNPDVRELCHGAYRILYRQDRDKVQILALCPGRSRAA